MLQLVQVQLNAPSPFSTHVRITDVHYLYRLYCCWCRLNWTPRVLFRPVFERLTCTNCTTVYAAGGAGSSGRKATCDAVRSSGNYAALISARARRANAKYKAPTKMSARRCNAVPTAVHDQDALGHQCRLRISFLDDQSRSEPLSKILTQLTFLNFQS